MGVWELYRVLWWACETLLLVFFNHLLPQVIFLDDLHTQHHHPFYMWLDWGQLQIYPMFIKISKFYRMQSGLQVFVEIFSRFFLMTSKGQDSIMVSEDIGSCWVADVTMGLWSQQAIWVLMELLEPPYMHQDRPVDWVGEPLGWRHWDWDFHRMGHRSSGTRFTNG